MKFLLALSVVALVAADLRMAARPKEAYKTLQRRRRGSAEFVTAYAEYMEPSAFGYKGLQKQRDGGAYDNFLRSNIDNEQDRRNFNNEAGKDHLPFRTGETAALDTLDTEIRRKLPTPAAAVAGKAQSAITVTPGIPYIIPLRWNNPHAAELEVNVWITQGNYKTAPIVVPVKKPTCSGEGHQDNAFAFTVPTDFLQLGAKVPGFTGCKDPGDCVLQTYSHSVESRQYSIGTPLVVTGDYPAPTAVDASQIEAKGIDNNLNLATLRDLCLPTNDPTSNIANAKPREARLISDVFNHAFQNSDYSAYSGQQPESISKQLQASAIIKQTAANRGELGKRLLKTENRAGRDLAQKILQASGNLIKKYEGVTNRIIDKLGNKAENGMVNTGAMENNAQGVTQELATCFRCLEGGATVTRRLKTNTYVPSFQIPQASIQAAKDLITNKKYKHVINDKGQLQIYTTVLQDMEEKYIELGKLGLGYQPAVAKTTTATMASKTDFKKRNARGRTDGGNYAAEQAKADKPAETIFTMGKLIMGTQGLLVQDPAEKAGIEEFSAAFAQAFEVAGPTGVVNVPATGADKDGEAFVDGIGMYDPDGMAMDGKCEDDVAIGLMTTAELDAFNDCGEPEMLFTPVVDAIEDPGPDTGAGVGVNGGVSGSSTVKASGFILVGVFAVVAMLF